MPIRSAAETVRVIFAKSVSENDGCTVWKGRINRNGYGRICFLGKQESVHRVIYSYKKGPIPNGMQVLHRCDVRCCINVDHLFLGTNDDNVADKVAKGRTASKLKASDVLRIKLLLSKGRLHAEIAKRFQVDQSTISRIGSGKRWGHMAGGY